MSTNLSGTVYFDNAATTSPLPCAIDKLNELTTTVMGNSMSAHRKGRQAQDALDRSHETLGRYFDVPPTHVIFTSGGTESNNLAIWGALGGLVQAFAWIKSGSASAKVLTSTVEHPASGKVFETLECMGAPVGWIGVDQEGLLDMGQLEAEIGGAERVRLLSLHHAQNEIGSLQDIKTIGRTVRAKHPDAVIHIDAIQSFMKVPVSLDELGIDLVSISSHKVGGPKGVGALILGRRFENRNPKIGLLINGSPQQFGLRPGTVAVPSIGAFTTAVEWGIKNFEINRTKLFELRQHLANHLPRQAVVNGPNDLSASNPRRVPQTLNFSIPGLPSAVTVEALSSMGYCVSAGSACHSTNPKPNETLMQMGVGRERALSSIRVSFAATNTIKEIDGFAVALQNVIGQYL